jgi:DNA polymerase V
MKETPATNVAGVSFIYTMIMIGLMDCNNFFVSCERLFRPDLLKRPVLVLSSNDGCVVSRSQEAKTIGIPMGVPYFQIKDECKKHRVAVFSSNFALYQDISRRVMSALKEECEQCEVYSVDEAFFAIEEGVSLGEIQRIRAIVTQKTGIPVSIGAAQTKTLAKLAASFAKKAEGVHMFDMRTWPDIAKETPCSSVWGIGRRLNEQLQAIHIQYVDALLSLDQSIVRKQFGIVGERLQLELRGVVVYPLGESLHIEHESYTSTRSFGSIVSSKEALKSSLGHHIGQLSFKLKADRNMASILTIMMKASRYSDFAFRKGVHTVTLEEPTNDTFVLTKIACNLVDEYFDSEMPYKRAGAILSGIVPDSLVTPTLFATDTEAILPKVKTKTQVVDALAHMMVLKMGKDAIKLGVTLGDAMWREKQLSKSREYTTKWSEIGTVKA